jgi:enoyl-CoA hydratase/carnithine racemase
MKFSPNMDDATRKVQHRLEMATVSALYDFPAITLCVIHGFAIGAGVSIATLSDMRIATTDSKFSMPEIDWGLSVASGGARIRRAGVRTGRVREILFSGRNFSGEEAAEMGLVDYAVAPDELDAKVVELEGIFGKKDPRSVRIMKAGLNAAERAGDWERGHVASYEFTVQMRKASNPAGRAAKFFDR